MSSRQLVSGIFWSVIEVIIKRVLDLIVKLVLARLLFPEDFGVIGMATVFISFIQVLNEAGMGVALIQKKEEDLTTAHFNTVFWANLFWSIFLYTIIVLFVAPYVVKFYNQPILGKIVPILSLSLLTSALNVVHKAQLMKELSFKKIAFVNNISTLIAGIAALIFAYLGVGIWALVINTVLAYFVSVPLFFYQTRWLPKFEFQALYLKEILTFGIFTTITQLIINVVSNADYLLIGKYVSASAVGFYSLAFMMTSLVKGQVTSMLNRVMYPFYSKIQDNIELLKSYYVRLIKYYAIVLYPLMLLLIVFGDEIIKLFYGNKWHDAALPMRILALAMLISVLTNGYNLLFRSIGKPKLEMQIQMILSIIIYLPCIVIGLYFNGYIGIAWGTVVSTAINFLIAQFLLKKYFRLSVIDLYKSLYPIFLTSILAGGISYILLIFTSINTFVIILAFIIIYLIMYVLTLKEEVKFIKSKILKK